VTGVVWRLTWRLALRRRRLLAWNLLVPVLLLVPVVASGAAAAHRAVVVAVFVVFFGAYGSCIPLLWDGMSGWVEKVRLTHYGSRRWLAERLAASVGIDFLELLPVNLLLLALVDAPLDAILPVLAATATALLTANLVGVLVAAVAGALGEAALGCAVVSLFALHAGGVFRTPDPGSAWATIEAWTPFRWIHEAWAGVLGGAPAPGATLALGGPPDYLAPQLATLFVLAAAVVAAGDLVARRLSA
jgi:hypothetical protein